MIRRAGTVQKLAATPYTTEKAARLLLATAPVADGQPAAKTPAAWFTGATPTPGGAHLKEDDEEHRIATMDQGRMEANCQMDDGLIPVLNFEQMAIHFHGHRFTIKDGMADSICYSARLNCEGGASLKVLALGALAFQGLGKSMLALLKRAGQLARPSTGLRSLR